MSKQYITKCHGNTKTSGQVDTQQIYAHESENILLLSANVSVNYPHRKYNGNKDDEEKKVSLCNPYYFRADKDSWYIINRIGISVYNGIIWYTGWYLFEYRDRCEKKKTNYAITT